MVRKDDDDDDLKDLLGETRKTVNNGNRAKTSRYTRGPTSLSIFDFCSQYTSMLCYFYPVYCGIFTFLVVFGMFLFFLTFIVNTTKEYGNIVHDHSNIQSSFDLKVGSIDHWCLGGGNENCPCEDPLQPLARGERPSWVQALKANRKKVRKLVDADVDVAFVGESVIEEMGGRWMGQKRNSPSLDKLEHMFENNFSVEHGGTIEGVALGIAGDTAPNVLWRLLQGEMEDGFNPAIWWVSLGNNDLGRMLCSEEVVEMGILRVVEEILEKRPNAHVVINSVFPMTDMRGGLYPVLSDYRDSFVGQRRASPFKKQAGDLRRSLAWEGGRTASTTTTVNSQTDDQYVKEKARVEEEARDRKAHMEKYFQKNFKKDPIMRDAAAVRQNRPGTFRAARKPIWTSIKAINKALEKFAVNHPRVTFFDCTPIFVKNDAQRDRSILLTKFISLRGHPTEAGFRRWEEQIKVKVAWLLKEYGLGTPDTFEQGDDDGSSDDEFMMKNDDQFASIGDGASIIGPGMGFGHGSNPNTEFGPKGPVTENSNAYAFPPRLGPIEQKMGENSFSGSGTAPSAAVQQATGYSTNSSGSAFARPAASEPLGYSPLTTNSQTMGENSLSGSGTAPSSAVQQSSGYSTNSTGAAFARPAASEPLGYSAAPNSGNSFVAGAANTSIATPLQPAATESSSGGLGESGLRGNWTAPAYVDDESGNFARSTGGATDSTEQISEPGETDDESNRDDAV